MKRLFFAIIVLMVSVSLYAQAVKPVEVRKSKRLPLIECIDNSLISLLDSILIKEEACDYYNDSLLLSLSFYQFSKHISISIKSTVYSELLMEKSPLAIFRMKDHLCFIFNSIPEIYFHPTTLTESIHYKEFILPRNLKKGEYKIPVLYLSEDIFSQWMYIYENGKYLQLYEIQPCIERYNN